MLRRIMLSVLPLTLIATSVHADDNELSIDVAAISDASAELVEPSLDVDVDQLAADAGTSKSADAVETCFRNFGYRHGGWGCSRGWSSCYSTSYWNCYRPCYSYPTYYCVSPTYQYSYTCAPVYNCYWGCY